MSREREGLLLCLVSAVGFGAMAILAKQAYAAGLEVSTLLALRFALAAALLWLLVAARGGSLGSPRALLMGALLGLVGYSLQAGIFFSALTRIDAGLASLLLYAYPAFVTMAAIALRQEHADSRRIGALVVASVGVALVLVGGGLGERTVDLTGALMALGAGVAYTVYILTSDTMSRGLAPLAFAATVCTGACLTFIAASLALGELHPGALSAEALAWIAALAVVSTVVPIVCFFAGLARVGPSTASILSTVEPPVTVTLAWLVLDERLGALQLAGGAFVLCAVVLLQWRGTPQRSAPSRSRSRTAAKPVT
jgi:drug/metabolite transporter (DMT)-like permease